MLGRRVLQGLESLGQDVRIAARGLRRSPGLVVVSALSLGLGIGVNVVLYTALDTIYAHRPSIADRDRVVGLEPGNANQLSYPNYADLRASGVFSDVVGFRATRAPLRSGDVVRRVQGLAVTADFFDGLGIVPSLGQTFSWEDAAPGRDPLQVVLSDAFWRRRLDARPDVVGSTLIIDGRPFVVRGVLSARHRSVVGWMQPSLYVPIGAVTLETLEDRGSPALTVLGRLSPGTTADQTQAALAAWAAGMERAFPERNRGLSPPAVYPAAAVQFRGVPAQFFLVGVFALAAFGLVLVIAAVNVAGILMARTLRRRHEIALRVALGAGRLRVMQLVVVESVLLALGGAAVGLPVAVAISRLPLPAALDGVRAAMTLDASAMVYAGGLVVAAALVCGLLPALGAARREVGRALRSGGGATSARLGARHALVVAQVAFSLLLLVAAALCVRSQIQVAAVDLGFDLDQGVVVWFDLDAADYTADARVRFAERAVDRVAAIPGVRVAAAASVVPLGGDSLVASFHPAGRTDLPGSRPTVRSVGPGYFRALAIPVLRGRDFDRGDVAAAPRVAIVNETFARTHLPDGEVIGRRVQTGVDPEVVVVGLVRDHKIDTIGETPTSMLYYPFAQAPSRLTVHARTDGPPAAAVATIRRAVADLDRAVPYSVETLRSATRLELEMRWVGTVLMGGLGGLGLALAMVGLFGVMAYVAASRAAEAGIRVALGASPAALRRLVLGQALRLVAGGVVGGLVLAALCMPAFATFLAVVSPFDGPAFAGAVAVILLTALVASDGPARRFARTDPMRALRRS